MIRADRVRALALDLPEALEVDHWGSPSYRVRGKNQGWTRVELRKVAAREFRALLEDAWRQVAPKRVAAAFTRGPRPPQEEKS